MHNYFFIEEVKFATVPAIPMFLIHKKNNPKQYFTHFSTKNKC